MAQVVTFFNQNGEAIKTVIGGDDPGIGLCWVDFIKSELHLRNLHPRIKLSMDDAHGQRWPKMGETIEELTAILRKTEITKPD